MTASEQRKNCEHCNRPINVGTVYVVFEHTNRFNHIVREYWHWDCWAASLLAFLIEVKVMFGITKITVCKAAELVTLEDKCQPKTP